MACLKPTHGGHRHARWTRSAGDAGQAGASNQIRITVNPDTGAPLAAGEVGEITMRSRNFKGYWNKPDATATTLKDGWVYGRHGPNGCRRLPHLHRPHQGMIKVSGYSVFPEEVRPILIKHPAVAQAAVLGVPDAEKGEVVRAFIVKSPGAGLDAAALVAWCRDNMAPYKGAARGALHRRAAATGAGKVLRRLLKA